ncbi:MAG: RQC-minor-1 family DNA-binding protein [Anaerolineae bacterium]|nr:RQC-minor-1 family DNA-binding protein [Anaerolineae bacterium]
MSRRVQRVRYRLNTRGIKQLPREDLVAILRGADDLIMSGGRNLLALVLKGSREKKLLELGLDQSPVYGYYRHLTREEVLARIDWAIVHGYLDIAYDYRLPLLVYTEEGWEIERETRVAEFLRGFDQMLEAGPPYGMEYLKDRNRDMILLLLDKVEATRDPKYIPLLQAWAEIDYKKVRKRIHEVIDRLTSEERIR